MGCAHCTLEQGPSSNQVITLTLDLVYEPHIISELQEHGKQTLDQDAHYHYLLPAGVRIDAQLFLELLQASPLPCKVNTHLPVCHLPLQGQQYGAAGSSTCHASGFCRCCGPISYAKTAISAG